MLLNCIAEFERERAVSSECVNSAGAKRPAITQEWDANFLNVAVAVPLRQRQDRLFFRFAQRCLESRLSVCQPV